MATPLDVVLALVRADGEVRRRMESALAGVHGLSLNDFVLLDRLREAPGGRLRRVDLAAALAVTGSAVTRQLAPLERTGLVDRVSDPHDARAALAALTPTGRERAQDAAVTAAEAANRVLASRLTPGELATLARLLPKLVP